MNLLHNNLLVTEDTSTEKKTAGGIILQSDQTSGHKPAIILGVSNAVAVEYADTLSLKKKVYLDWSKSMPEEIDGLKCAIVDIEHVKLVL